MIEQYRQQSRHYAALARRALYMLGADELARHLAMKSMANLGLMQLEIEAQK